jgi:threonine dehydrogenase-like Zn-dependent dehydrogenase
MVTSAGARQSDRVGACAVLAHRDLDVGSFASHHLPLEDAPHAYEIFQKKEDGAFKIILQP